MRGLVVLVALLAAALEVVAQKFVGVYIEAGKDISKIDYTSVTHVFYAFASLDAATGNLKLPSQFNQAIVDSIHAGNPRRPKAILSVGGYYETNFSPIFNNNTLRQNFVNSTINTIQQYGLDGIDIDWEYPGRAGISNNYLSVDSANFVLGLKALKTGLNAKGVLASISATSLPYGFIGADGNYLTDLSGYAANLDFLNIMGYDLNGGSWTTSSAPNAPLGTPLNGDKSAGGIDGSIQKLIKAGFPANKLVLGVPFYGRYVKTVQSMATNGPNNQAASSNSGQPGAWIDYSAITSPAYSTDGPDVLLYKTLQMFVQNPENNLIQYFDNATMTPWFYDIANSVYVTYDNPLSIYVKGSYAACMGLKGVFAWEATHDNNMLLPYLAAGAMRDIAASDVTTCFPTVQKITSPPTIANVVAPNYLSSRCGTDWANAASKCGTPCFFTDALCPNGEHCFAQLDFTICRDPIVNNWNSDGQLVGIRQDWSPLLKGTNSAQWSQLNVTFKATDIIQMPDLTFVTVAYGKNANSLSWCPSLSPTAVCTQFTAGVKSIALLTDQSTFLGVGTDGTLWTKAGFSGAWNLVPNSGTVIDITVLSNGVILGTGTDFNIYSRQTLNSNWVLVSGGCCVYSTAQALDGSILGIGTDNAVYWKQSLSSNWQYMPNSKGVLAVAPRVLMVGIGMDRSLWAKGSLTGGWTQIPSKFRFLDMVQLPDLTFVAVGPSNDLWACKTLSDCAQAPRPGGIKSIDVLTDGVTLVAVGMDGLLYTRTIASDWTQVPNSGTVVDITVLANGVILGTAPDGYLYTKNTLTSSWQYLGACCVSRTAQLPDGSILGIGTDNAIYKKQTLTADWTYVANSAAVISVVSLY